MAERGAIAHIDGKKLDEKARDDLGSESFAVPGKRKLPIHDAEHVRNALARFNQTEGLTPAEKKSAMARIRRAAKKFGVSVSAEAVDEEVDEPEEIEARAGYHIEAMSMMAMSITLPHVDNHPNKMQFSGVLTRIDEPSDRAPHGSGGKKVMITRAAAENALASLLGMGVDLTKGFTGHDAQKKVGIITAARIDGNAINIEGFIYAADFPHEALRVKMEQADLGFSFEARDLDVEDINADPLVVTACMFTGAAILLKNDAAYTTTALAAAAAKEHEMTEAVDAVKALLAEALKPISDTLAAQAAAIDEMKKQPNVVMAVNAAMSKVEPHAARLEAAAEKMEQEGVGAAGSQGHVHHLRRMADSMRADAARGKIPDSYHDSGAYWAMAQQQQAQQLAATAAPLQAVKVEETPEFKALQAAFDAEKTKSADAIAAMDTKIKDIQAAANAQRTTPDRKTMTPEVLGVLSRLGIGETPENGGTVPIGKIDAAFAQMGASMSTEARIRMKKVLADAGVIANTGRQY